MRPWADLKMSITAWISETDQDQPHKAFLLSTEPTNDSMFWRLIPKENVFCNSIFCTSVGKGISYSWTTVQLHPHVLSDYYWIKCPLTFWSSVVFADGLLYLSIVAEVKSGLWLSYFHQRILWGFCSFVFVRDFGCSFSIRQRTYVAAKILYVIFIDWPDSHWW